MCSRCCGLFVNLVLKRAVLFCLSLICLTSVSMADVASRADALELRFVVDIVRQGEESVRKIEVAPRIRTLPGKEAEIVVSEGSDHGIRLKVLPKIAVDGLIDLTLEVTATVDSTPVSQKMSFSTPLNRPVKLELTDGTTIVRVDTFVSESEQSTSMK